MRIYSICIFRTKNRNQGITKRIYREKLSNEETGEIYGKRKIDVEPVFGFLKAILGFTRMSVRGEAKVENELGFALMAVNLRKYIANFKYLNDCTTKNGHVYLFLINMTVFIIQTSSVPASFYLCFYKMI